MSKKESWFVRLFIRLFRSKRLEKALKLFEISNDFSVERTPTQKVEIDLESYLSKFLKEGFNGKVNADSYKIVLHYIKGGKGSGKFGVYYDATYGFVLLKEEETLCSIGFDPRGINAILVKQIQGKRGKQEELRPFRWEKMLLQIVVDWARQNNIKRVDVIRAQDSEWYGTDEKRHERMYIKYDVTARRLGFQFNELKKVYSLHL